MDLQVVYRAGAYIRNTLKRALHWDHDEYLYSSSKRLALQDTLYESSQIYSFMRMLENPVIKSFLKFDTCYLLADNYLIAIAYIYLDRAKVLLSECSIHYLLSALYLAHEIQEDNDSIRQKIVHWYPGKNERIRISALHHFKDRLWFQMNFKCHVSKRHCDRLMQLLPNWGVWQRKREESHSGAFHSFAFQQTKCKHCSGPYFNNPLVVKYSPDDSDKEKSHDYKDDVLATSDWELDTTSDVDTTLT